MKELTTEMFTFTEIGGVGEMIYKAVRFPAYYSEHDETQDDDIIYPAFTYQCRPDIGTDYSITGQKLLAQLCNLYKKINVPNNVENITELILDWCQKHIYPYYIDDLNEFIEGGDFDDPYFHVNLQKSPAFGVKRFIRDLCELGSAYEFYDVLQKIHYDHNASAGRNFYYVGRFCESNPLLEKYQQYTDDEEYLKRIDNHYDNLICSLIELFPYVKMRLKQNKKTHKIEMGAAVNSVFDIAWYAFARMVSTISPPTDTDPDYMFSQGSLLTCMACGEYFERHSSRQRYCDNPNCQAERNNRKAREYYKRKHTRNN